MVGFLTRNAMPMLILVFVVSLSAIDPALAQSLKKAESGLDNFLKFFSGNMGNIIVALAIIGVVFGILMRRLGIGSGVGVVVLAMVLANAKDIADQLDAWF